ncbi:MAG: lipoprotein-releasing ABC transporter permease subunit [Candidatus Thiodiazotropha sp. (ex. Lucinisca nassula)]|nr:lipoprotein-releasing ABC transporter permease subunit [Candidatus Thiodiazotropha sp. (ex. Lucinisca nassula)]MBW9261036.1 lipoprotein-releasing ABC transporter permease subunit [Candidatus Thiodiazotropha sp. (ex. Lucinisca nassula)]MBW9271168.1 lipoprotein-releasing ABC transporter permease subunit [Candidatus Thiodiazotropha sp. (ex. Lucinisca nassula)]
MFKPIEFYIGLRYTRAKRRNHFISFISVISMVGIMLGVVALIVVLSVMNGFHKEIRERILGMASHATISGVNGELADWRSVESEAAKFPHVVGKAPYVEGQGMLISGQKVSGVLLRGILPEQEGEVSDVISSITQGTIETLKPGSYGIVLGRELANVLGVGVGDRVTLVTPQVNVTPAGIMPRLKRLTVSAIFQVGMGEYDRGVAILHIKDAAKLMRLQDGVTGVRLKLDDLYLAPQVSRELAMKMGGYYRISDWTMQHRNFFSALRTEKRMMTIILSLIVAVAAFNIVSTMVMVVTDKQSDIAILRTLGASPGSIMGIFMVQGATIGIVGNIFGMLGGTLLAQHVEEIVSWIEQALSVDFLDPSIYYITKLPSDPHTSDILLIGGMAFLITLLATLYPAWKASRTQPAEALRYE